MEDMSMDITLLSEKLQREATEKNVAYDVGEHYLQAFDKGDYSVVTLFDHNLKVETQEMYGELQNKELPPLTQAIHEFCEKYDFEGVESVQNRTAPMVDPVLLEYNFLQARETTQACNQIEDEFEDTSISSFAIFRLKDNEKNEQLSQIDLTSLKILGEVPDKGDYNCIFSGNLEEIMPDCFEVMENTPAIFEESFGSALFDNIGNESEFLWKFTELLVGDVIGVQHEGEITYFYNDTIDLQVIDFEQQPFKLSLRSDEIPSPTVVDLNSISSEEFLNLVGNYENVENIVREVVPMLQAKDEITTELEDIDSDTIYQDFHLVKSEVVAIVEVALLTNSTEEVFVVADRGEYSEKEVNDNEWVTPEMFHTLDEALVGYDDRIYGAMEMHGVFEELEEQEKSEQQVESQKAQDDVENTSKPLAEAMENNIEKVQGFAVVDREIVDSSEVFLGENQFGHFATFVRDVTEDDVGPWKHPHYFSGGDYETNHEQADNDFNQRVEFRQTTEKTAEHLTSVEESSITTKEEPAVVPYGEEENLFSATFTTQERVVIQSATDYAYDNLSEFSPEEKSLMIDIQDKIDSKGDLSNFEPDDYTFEVNGELLEKESIIVSGEELEVISEVCSKLNSYLEELPDSYRDVLNTIIDKVDNPVIEVQQGDPTRTVANTYTITDSKVVGDFEIAMGESEQGMYATWERCISADESKGFEANWNFGHYHMEDKEGAISDFQQRIEESTPTKDRETSDLKAEKPETAKEKGKEEQQPKKSVLDNLKKIKAETDKKDAPKLPTKGKTDQSIS